MMGTILNECPRSLLVFHSYSLSGVQLPTME